MSHRKILGFLSDHRYLGSAAVLLLVFAGLAGLAQFYSIGTFYDQHRPSFGECSFNRDTGNIQGGCADQQGRIEKFSGGVSNAYQDGEPVSKHFWVKINGIQVYADGGDEEKAPQFWWLYKHGFTNQETQQEIRQGDFPDEVELSYGELKWNSDIREELEAGTVCRAKIKPEATGGVDITTSLAESFNTDVTDAKWNNRDDDGDGRVDEGFQEYNDEPEENELYIGKVVPDPVTVTADKIEITENSMKCRFDFTEVMNKGMQLNGKFVSWSGDTPMIGGEDGDEGYTTFNVDFSLDSDLDGFIDPNDKCDETKGIKAKNGCPNQASKILGVEGPRNVTVGENVTYSVKVQNPDSDSTTISWSNGDTGKSASYRFNSTGTASVSVTVDDGFTETTESITVNVKEKSLIGKLSEFFAGIWKILWYNG